MTPSSNDPAEARKRRKEIIQSQRSENELIANGVAALAANGSGTAPSPTNGSNGKNPIIGVVADVETNTATNNANGDGAEKKPPKKRKVSSGDSSSRKNGKKNPSFDDENKSKKTQIRYDPDVPMSKDQLASWRREARRVRNRESAAASRQRIRNRISELEDEVREWKSRYSQAIQRLDALEKCISANATNDAELPQQDAAVLPSEQQPQQQESSEQPAAPPSASIEETQDDAAVI